MTTPRPCLGASAGSFALDADGLLSELYGMPGKADASRMSPDNPADCDDVAAALRGDGEAYRRLVERHQNEIAGVMSRFTRDPRRLEELVQDAFVEAYTSLPGFKPGMPLYPWLRKIAVRAGYRHWKRLARSRDNVPLDDIGEIAACPDDTTPERAAELLHGLLAGLPPRDRLVLTLLYLDGCSTAEAAELTGWSKVMVKVQAHRARGKLKRLLEREMEKGAVAP